MNSIQSQEQMRSLFRQTPCSDGVPEYDPAAVLRLYVGLNEAIVEEELRRNRQAHEYGVDKVMGPKAKRFCAMSHPLSSVRWSSTRPGRAPDSPTPIWRC